mgnify:CR=1 FL=1
MILNYILPLLEKIASLGRQTRSAAAACSAASPAWPRRRRSRRTANFRRPPGVRSTSAGARWRTRSQTTATTSSTCKRWRGKMPCSRSGAFSLSTRLRGRHRRKVPLELSINCSSAQRRSATDGDKTAHDSLNTQMPNLTQLNAVSPRRELFAPTLCGRRRHHDRWCSRSRVVVCWLA